VWFSQRRKALLFASCWTRRRCGHRDPLLPGSRRLKIMASNSGMWCAGCTRRRRQIRAAPCIPFPTWDPPPPGRARRGGVPPQSCVLARRAARRRLAARRGRCALLRTALQGCGRCRVCSFNTRRPGGVRGQREGAARARQSVGTRAAVRTPCPPSPGTCVLLNAANSAMLRAPI